MHGRSAAPGMVVAQWQAAGMINSSLPRCRELIQVTLSSHMWMTQKFTGSQKDGSNGNVDMVIGLIACCRVIPIIAVMLKSPAINGLGVL